MKITESPPVERSFQLFLSETELKLMCILFGATLLSSFKEALEESSLSDVRNNALNKNKLIEYYSNNCNTIYNDMYNALTKEV